MQTIDVAEQAVQRPDSGPAGEAGIVDAKFDVLKRPEIVLSYEEAEIILRLRPNLVPGPLTLVLKNPINGRQMYTYRFRNARP